MLKHHPSYYAEKYKHHLMKSAFEWAKASKAVRLQVGCVIYLNNHTLSYGWNGQGSGSESEVCEVEVIQEGLFSLVTHPGVIHAERNSIEKITDKSLLVGAIVFTTHSPCENCSKLLVDSGVSMVYYSIPYRCDSGLNHLLKNGIIVEKLEI